MSALKGLVSVSFCVSNQHEKTESHLLTSTRRPQRKAAPLCEQWSQTCATYVVIGTVVWSFIHIAVLLNATALTCFKHIKTGRKETHRKKCKRDESSIRQQKLCHFWFPSHVFKYVTCATTWTGPSRCCSMRVKYRFTSSLVWTIEFRTSKIKSMWKRVHHSSSTQNLLMVLSIVPWTARCESLEGTKGCPDTMCGASNYMPCTAQIRVRRPEPRMSHCPQPNMTLLQYMHVLNVDPEMHLGSGRSWEYCKHVDVPGCRFAKGVGSHRIHPS